MHYPRPARRTIPPALLVLLPALLLLPVAAVGNPGEGFLAVQRQVESVQSGLIKSTVALRVGFGTGSGVIVSPDGLVLTAAHVVAGRTGRPVTAVLSDGKAVAATVLAFNRESDLGLVKIGEGSDFPSAPLGDSSVVRRRQ